MMDAKLRVLARHSRKRSRQVLAKAETMQDADARRTMRRVAASYRRLAQRLERESPQLQTHEDKGRHSGFGP